MKERDFGIDLIKFLACVFVIAVHFALYSGFYATPIVGPSMFLQSCARWFFYICVPLFMITTGYLQYKKGLSKKYYMSLLPILASYIFIAIVCYFFRKYYLKEDIDYLVGILGLFNFTINPYSWYVEMFIGLFLIIPFINIIFNALKTKQQRLLLIGIMLFLTAGTSLLSSFSLSSHSIDISTNWWVSLYPITFYFIGAYIREYQVKLSLKFKVISILTIIAIVIFESILSKKDDLISDANKFNGYHCIYTVIVAVLFFLIVYQVNIRSQIIRALVAGVAERTLDIYLFSYIFDRISYPELVKLFYHGTPEFGVIAFISIPLVLISALAASILKGLLFSAVRAIFIKRDTKPGYDITA